MNESSPQTAGNDNLPEESGATRREVFAWASYDWANSAYSTILITIVVGYLKYVVLPGNAGTLAYGYGIGISMLFAAVLSPIVGAIADARATKHRWLSTTALGGAALAVVMGVLPPSNPVAIVSVFVLMSVCFELSLGFYNAFLPEISTEATVNRISAWGFALGYLGGAIPLILALGIVMFGGRIGLPDADALHGDYNATREATFATELPNANYRVNVTLGDAAAARNGMAILLEGEQRDVVDTASGAFESRSFDVEVSDGELTLDLEAIGEGKSQVAINSLEILAADGEETVVAFDFGTAGSATAEGYAWVTKDDKFESHEYAERVKPVSESSPDQPEASLTPPEKHVYGWKSGEVKHHDAVNPLRLRISIVMMGLWWGFFSLPIVFILRDRGHSAQMLDAETPGSIRSLSWAATAKLGVSKVVSTLSKVRLYRTLSIFLIGFLVYNDGIQTVISQASQFAIDMLSMSTQELTGVVLMIQFLAIPGALLIGFLSDRMGQHRTLKLCLAIWVVLLCGAYFINAKWQFWMMGVVLAVVMGGTQSVSRAVMASMTPKAYTAEFFGFYNFSGKATSFLGPIVYSTVQYQTGSPRLAIISLLAFLLIGGALIYKLDFKKGQQEAHAAATE